MRPIGSESMPGGGCFACDKPSGKKDLSGSCVRVKLIKFKLGEKVIEAKLQSKVDKKSLYGYARRSIEKDGRPLSRGVLCPDGTVLMRDELASNYVDPEGSPVDEVITELDGKPEPIQPSSFDQEAP